MRAPGLALSEALRLAAHSFSRSTAKLSGGAA